MICDTRSGDLSSDFSTFVHICLCLFTCVWSHVLFWKLYIVPMLRELTSLSFNINYDTLVLSLIVRGRPGDWGASLHTEPKSALGSHIWTMGQLIITLCPIAFPTPCRLCECMVVCLVLTKMRMGLGYLSGRPSSTPVIPSLACPYHLCISRVVSVPPIICIIIF